VCVCDVPTTGVRETLLQLPRSRLHHRHRKPSEFSYMTSKQYVF
jgi:hypothetical protein